MPREVWNIFQCENAIEDLRLRFGAPNNIRHACLKPSRLLGPRLFGNLVIPVRTTVPHGVAQGTPPPPPGCVIDAVLRVIQSSPNHIKMQQIDSCRNLR